MKTIEQWLDEYNDSHQNSFNKLTHWICVPAIMLSLLGLLWSVKTPDVFMSLPFVFNWAVLFAVMSILYYLLISPRLALGMLVVAAVMLCLLQWLDGFTTPLWLISTTIFVVAWIGQFIGHHVEGKRPSFFKDVQFLLIGPLWLLSSVYRGLNISY